MQKQEKEGLRLWVNTPNSPIMSNHLQMFDSLSLNSGACWVRGLIPKGGILAPEAQFEQVKHYLVIFSPPTTE